MSGSASLDLEWSLLQHTLAIAPMAALSRVYVALCQTAPTEASSGSEVAGGGYSRVAATFALLSGSTGAANTTTIEFPIATSAWGAVGWFELWDQVTGGTRLYWGALTTPATVAAGDSVRFSAGTLVVMATDVSATGPFLPLSGGQLLGDLTFLTNARIGMDNAAYGGAPNMFMRSDGGAVVFHADGWNEYTPSAFRGINFKVFGNATADEYWGTTGGPEGNGATLKVYSVSGGWPTIGSILASNEGQLMLGNDTGTVLNIQGPTGKLSINYLRIRGAGSGESPAFLAVGTDTNIGMSIYPKGNGALVFSNPSGSNARGAYARDLQGVRVLATQVASGGQSVISGGNSNTASGSYTTVSGGNLNNADGNYSSIPGGNRAWSRGQHGWFGWASSLMQGLGEGEAQGSWRMLGGLSTGGAAVRLTSDSLAINNVSPNINSVYLGNDRAQAMSVKLVGIDATAASTRINAYFNDVLVGKDALGGFSIYLGTPRTLGVDLPTVAITVGAENLLSIVVTPANSNAWHFLAKLSCAEVA